MNVLLPTNENSRHFLTMNLKFNDYCNLILESLNDEFLSNDLYNDIIDEYMQSGLAEYFEKLLNKELRKVKPKNAVLKHVKLDVSENEDPENDGMWRVMWVSENNPDIIHVNLQPLADFINDNGGEITKEIIDSAFESYYMYNPHGSWSEHIIQHECAHVIDHKTNAGRDGFGSHDEVFEKIRKELDAIEPRLDKTAD